jgi:hypothetical protein
MSHTVIQMLEDTATRIRDIEDRAKEQLHQGKNQEGYAELMREKAEVLAGLAGRAEPLLQEADPVFSERVCARLSRFSQSAGQALDLDSLFYMSALLYPEDYQEGRPNDLEAFIGRLKTDYSL